MYQNVSVFYYHTTLKLNDLNKNVLLICGMEVDRALSGWTSKRTHLCIWLLELATDWSLVWTYRLQDLRVALPSQIKGGRK